MLMVDVSMGKEKQFAADLLCLCLEPEGNFY